jgi:hypothetical protein
VNNAKEYSAGLMVANLNHRFNLILYGLSAIGITLHQVANMLVDDDKVIVFVEYIFDSKHITT